MPYDMLWISLSCTAIAAAFCLVGAVWFGRTVAVMDSIYSTPLENVPTIITRAISRRRRHFEK